VPCDDNDADLWTDCRTGEITLEAFLCGRGDGTIEQRHAVLAVGCNICPDVSLKNTAASLRWSSRLCRNPGRRCCLYPRGLVPYGAVPAICLCRLGISSRDTIANTRALLRSRLPVSSETNVPAGKMTAP
jgi:hypothetical protein